MAPQEQNPKDPNKIDIGLSLFGGTSQDIIENLVNQLSAVSTHLATVAANTGYEKAQGAQNLATEMRANVRHRTGYGQSDSTRISEDALPGSATDSGGGGPAPNLPPNAVDPGEPPDFEARFNKRLSRAAQAPGFGGKFDEYFRLREPMEANAGTQFGSHATPYGPGGVGDSGGKAPGRGGPPSEVDPNAPRWLQNLSLDRERYDRASSPQGLYVPQIGEFTTQNKLQMASDWLTRSALNAQDPSSPSATLRGRAGTALDAIADQAGPLHIAHQHLQRAHAAMTATQTAGTQLGFERGARLSVGPFGLQLPDLHEKGALYEGLRQRFQSARLQAMGGISGEQAGEITNSIAASGWSGGHANDLAFRLLGPLTQQGHNPQEIMAAADPAIRNGLASIEQVRSVFDRLGPSARKLHMSLSELDKSITEYADTAHQMGATHIQGLQTGRDLTTTTGLPAQFFSQAMQSPMVQGQALINSGVMPSMMGLQPAGMQVQNFDAAFQLAQNLSSPFARPIPGKPITVGGRQYATPGISGSDAQIAQTAQTLGMPVDLVKRYAQQRGQIQAQASAQELNKEWTNQVRGLGQAGDHWVQGKRFAGLSPDMRRAMGMAPYSPGHMARGHVSKAEARALLQDHPDPSGHGMLPGFNTVLEESRQAGVFGETGDDANQRKRIQKLRDLELRDPGAAGKKLRQLIEKHAPQAGPQPGDVKVAFTPAAAKVFKQVFGNARNDFKASSNAGGPSLANFMQDPSHATQSDITSLLRDYGGGGSEGSASNG